LKLNTPPNPLAVQDTREIGGRKRTQAQAGGGETARSPVQPDTDTIVALAFLLGFATAFGASTVYRRFFKRIKNAEWVTPDLLARRRWITGVVTRCVFHSRVLTLPFLICHPLAARLHAAWAMQTTSVSIIHPVLAGVVHSSSGMYLPLLEVRAHPQTPPSMRGAPYLPRTTELRKKTIHIRMAAMDAPEVSLPTLLYHYLTPESPLPMFLFFLHFGVPKPTHFHARLKTAINRTGIAFWQPGDALFRRGARMA